ncbi:hypothetical protein Q669_31950 [Labrenzia sp. C1B10]|uniref:ABC transporter substrate-binding protein n=1 Tax=unclassified Labrenzia TaxID=2648686 RepID=UPI0003B87F04|nr:MULTISPECIES: ABC transporter substrate-binding protein [unclassified Labrenzia]ERP92517.1 hypothetical protein Q669_31950 [Labrenzia sp. C1B10]ERS04001.1 hypothetical protein Q675_30975 [Labrenzia sp. C1B70]
MRSSKVFLVMTLALWLQICPAVSSEPQQSVLVGLSAEFGNPASTSAQAIRLGIETAIFEINSRGGVVDGRPLELLIRDNRSLPARGLFDLKEMAAMPDLVAVFGGRFSPVVLEMLQAAHVLKIPLLDPWAAADGITDHNFEPSFSFRLSLKDSWALQTMIAHARAIGLTQLGLLVPNNAWGRSSLAAAEKHVATLTDVNLINVSWYNSSNDPMIDYYGAQIANGVDGLLLVANELEGKRIVDAVYSYPDDLRVPIISHWGITGSDFVSLAGEALRDIDLSVVQTFTFVGRDDPKAQEVLAVLSDHFGIDRISDIPAPVGFAHAYDLTHILARAIDAAASTNREEIRDALENVKDYQGLLRYYERPFSDTSHDALRKSDVFIGRYQEDGTIARHGFAQ